MIEDQYELLNKFPKDKSYLSEKQLEENCREDASYDEITATYNELDKPGYINGAIPNPGLRITDKGLKALCDYEAKAARDKETAELNFKKLKLDVKNSERIFKTYWWTFCIAVAAFLISACLLILKLTEQ